MKATALVNEIRQYCRECASEELRIKYSRYFREGYDAYGMSQPQMDMKIKELHKRGDVLLRVVMEAAPDLLSTGKYEETSFVLGLINKKEKEYTVETFRTLGWLFASGIANWAHADMLGMYIMPKFIKKEIVSPDDFREWINSPFKYQRRTVPVTFIKVLDPARGYKHLFDIIEPLMTDKERVVHQGAGWFLREAWKKDAAQTEPFLFKYKETAARLIFQYATEKMTKEQKERFRRSKKNKSSFTS
ncbi:MAG: DNA alkylation repair protein [Bacteroidia bacterium]|nr:MAG: DNA alkylation repair protein [Bacteroidia bacterium]